MIDFDKMVGMTTEEAEIWLNKQIEEALAPYLFVVPRTMSHKELDERYLGVDVYYGPVKGSA